jgi:hypothetical protein
MAWQGDRVPLDQTDMRFALKIATTSKAQLLGAAIEEMKQLF